MDPDLLAEELEACQRRGRLPKAVGAKYQRSEIRGQMSEVRKRQRSEVRCQRSEKDRDQRSDVRGHRTEVTGQKRGLREMPTSDLRSPTSGATRAWGRRRPSGGGMLASDDEELIEQARFLSQQARDPAPHYEHSQIGYNYRMSNVLAAIGRGQLRVLDERVKKKREIFDYYREALGDLPGIEFMPEAPYGRCTRWLTVILITPEEFGADREAVRLALEAENIEARPVWPPARRAYASERSRCICSRFLIVD